MRKLLGLPLAVLLVFTFATAGAPALELPHCMNCSCFDSCNQTCVIDLHTEICDLWLCEDYPECQSQTASGASYLSEKDVLGTGAACAGNSAHFPMSVSGSAETSNAVPQAGAAKATEL